MLIELFMILLQNHLQRLNGNKIKREFGDGLIFPFLFFIKNRFKHTLVYQIGKNIFYNN